MMKKIEIFEPAMCCSTGVCGPSVNPELIRVAAVVENLKKEGIHIIRHNLSSEPQAFVQNTIINTVLNDKGMEILPVTMVDGAIVKEGGYLTNAEFAEYLQVGIDIVQSKTDTVQNSTCNCGSDDCC
ncbi:arsenite efflux transporter metallochaperone ArsD [Megasphaera paucivorans]|nr:arsenite efflux transporter metallochaperone ArsD [Megasphaera paucivorans]